MPGTSAPMRFTISWNIMVWLHSSTASCRQYRYSGEPFGVQNDQPVRFSGMFHPVASDLTMAEAKRSSINAFGIQYWAEEGLITHSLQTAVIDRDGREELKKEILKGIRQNTDVKVDEVLFTDVAVQ